MTKRGGSKRSLLHAGHLDGLLSRVRSLKTNSQARHCAGSTRKRSLLCLSERATCSRWPETSFSLIPTRAESSRAVSGPSPSTCLSADRTVACRSVSLCERGLFANGSTSDQWEVVGSGLTIIHSMRLAEKKGVGSLFTRHVDELTGVGQFSAGTAVHVLPGYGVGRDCCRRWLVRMR